MIRCKNALAIDLVEPITNSPSKKAALQQDYKEALAEARKNNSFERGAAEAHPCAGDTCLNPTHGAGVDPNHPPMPGPAPGG